MVESDNLRYTKMALNNGSGAIPALAFGTLIPEPTHPMPEWESEELEATLTAVGVAVDQERRCCPCARRSHRRPIDSRAQASVCCALRFRNTAGE